MENKEVRLIDADELLDFINSLNFDDYNLYSEIFDYIDNAPTIDAQPVKRGRWSECWRDPARSVMSVICSACEGASLAYLPKKDLAVEDVPEKIRIQMPYCPKCGARMEVDEDEQAQ